MKIPSITTLNKPEMINAAARLNCTGQLTSRNNFTYLSIDDAYIHQLNPFFEDEQIKKPDYFGEEALGAHISVIYPEEEKEINEEDLYGEHQFEIQQLVAANINQKTYYALLVESQSLLKLRKKYDLPELLKFEGHSICFHITIGVKF